MNKREVGKIYEEKARKYLEDNDYVIEVCTQPAENKDDLNTLCFVVQANKEDMQGKNVIIRVVEEDMVEEIEEEI